MFAFLGGLLNFAWSIATAIAPYAAFTAGIMTIQHQQAEKAVSQSEKKAQAAAETQAKAAAREYAIQNAPLTAKQMQKVVGQREIKSLAESYIEKERNPRVYTLPTAQPSDTVTRINQAIHKILTGAA